jgi:hypothetical protein
MMIDFFSILSEPFHVFQRIDSIINPNCAFNLSAG